MKQPLKDQIAFVTGAAAGIGFAISECFIEAGATVILTDVDDEAGREAAKGLNQSAPERAHYLHCDVAVTDDVNRAVTAVLEDHGRIDVLVNNAAVSIGGRIDTMPEDDWNRVINTNLTSAYRTIHAVLPQMLERGKGSIINLCSTQAHRSWADWTAYATAMGGLKAMTTQLAGQFGAQGIRVNAISPGAIDTPMCQQRVEEEGQAVVEKWEKMHALGRMGRPEEVARAALFLAADGFVSGHDLVVDGGLCTLPRYFD